jgi:hypothetical protein
MREIFVNGVAFRYKTERDLSIILRHSRNPARLKPLCRLVADVKQQQNLIKYFNDRDVIHGDGRPAA